MKKKIITTSILIALAMSPALLAQDQWLHLRVSSGEEGEKFNMNLPLATIQSMLPSLAERGMREGKVALGHGDITVENLRAMWSSIRNQGDFQIAEIEEKGTQLEVAMEGDHLIARSVEGSDKQVNVQVPAVLVDAILSGEGDELNLQAALDALAGMGSAQMVKVQDGEKNIELWIDSSASGN